MDQITFSQPINTPQYEPEIVPVENVTELPAQASEYPDPVYVFVKDSEVVDNYGDSEYVYVDLCLNVGRGPSSDHVTKRLKFNRNTLAQDAIACRQYKNDNSIVVESEVNPYELKKASTQRMCELAGIPRKGNFV